MYFTGTLPRLTASIALLSVATATLFGVEPNVDTWASKNTAGSVPSGTFSYEILNGLGLPSASRLTFLALDGSRPVLFTNQQAAPNDLAVRGNIIYTLSGRGTITVPVGTYTVWASRGMEYSISHRVIEVKEGSHSIWTPTLTRDVDTRGWVSGDFHLHTLTHSGHGDSNMPERIISLIGEGVEFAVATDHNHNTDYEPTMRDLGVPEALRAVVGNEVSTPIGHFNAFPLDPNDPAMRHDFHDAHELFKLIREQSNPYNTTPVIQVNHPRWGGIDYFGQLDLNPVTGDSSNPEFSYEFDSVEIFNENEGWGYVDADERDLNIGSGSFSVLRDWFNLLNRGYRVAAVGNSDSHDVASELAGWPRNLIASSTDIPSEINPAEIAANIRNKRVYTTYGPVVDFSVNSTMMGGACTANPSSLEEHGAGWVDVSIRVQVPSWIDCDRVMIVVNGEIARTIDVEESTDIVRLDTTERIELKGDSWISLLVEGDTPLDPIVHSQGRPIYPWAVLNPVWVDVDRDGQWVSPLKQAERKLKTMKSKEILAELSGAPSSVWVNVLTAASMTNTLDHKLIQAALTHKSRHVRLAALTVLEHSLMSLHEQSPDIYRIVANSWSTPLRDILATSREDQHLFIRTLLALYAAGDEATSQYAFKELLSENMSNTEKPKLRNGFDSQLIAILGGSMITRWSVFGFYDAPEFCAIQSGLTLVEKNPNASTYELGERSAPVMWKTIEADDRGYIDLRKHDADGQSPDHAIATARVWFMSDGTPIDYSFGADDASRIILNGEVVYEEFTHHGADPLQSIGVLHPKSGLNQLLITVENGTGGYGFYFRMFDEKAAQSATIMQPSESTH